MTEMELQATMTSYMCRVNFKPGALNAPMNHRMRPGGAPSAAPVFIAYIDPARFFLNEDRPQLALLGVRDGTGVPGQYRKSYGFPIIAAA
ncbi:MAG TPA: hypothetical protein VLB06_10460 [Sulfuricaulis sp.]|nr:hypothetical protein [Sulfuricaulis sp.]